MALALNDRVQQTGVANTTVSFTLTGSVTGFQSFAVIGNGNLTYYTIAGQTGNEWEVGIGTYTSSGTTLARTTVLSNSSGTQPSALSFSAGTKDVFVAYPAGVSSTNGVMVQSDTVSQSTTISTGSNGLSVGPVTVASGQSVTVASGQRWVVI